MIDGKRHYEINGNEKLPSVTTILSATQPIEKTESLKAWRARVGEDSATRIVDEAAARGTAMHKILEKYILEEGYLDLTNVGKQAHNMAMQVIQQGLSNVTEFYGTECTLYYPGLYAGQTDLIANHKNEMAVIDFKQTNKPKRREWIEDMFLQLVAYATAHDCIYGTKIEQGVILMCTPDNFFQRFIVNGSEFREWKWKWLQKVSDYYELKLSYTGV